MHKYIDSRSANQRHSLLRQQHGLPLEGTQGLLCAAAFGCALASLLWPDAASASEGNLTGGALELFKAFLVGALQVA